MDILSLLENRSCYFCGGVDDGQSGLCHDCRKTVISSSRKKGTLCVSCSQPVLGSDPADCPFCSSVTVVDRLFSISYFNSNMKELLTLFKSGQMPCLRFFFASLVNEYLKKLGLYEIAVVPIPPRKGKIRSQGWDQVDLICKTLKKEYGVSIETVLERTDRIQQKTLSFEERERHMKSILRFTGKKSRLQEYPSLVLFDDIFTSGATISAAAELLRQNYIGELSALVLCSVI